MRLVKTTGVIFKYIAKKGVDLIKDKIISPFTSPFKPSNEAFEMAKDTKEIFDEIKELDEALKELVSDEDIVKRQSSRFDKNRKEVEKYKNKQLSLLR